MFGIRNEENSLTYNMYVGKHEVLLSIKSTLVLSEVLDRIHFKF